MKVWVTKWAVSQGIFLVEAKETDWPDTIEVLPSVKGSLSYYLKKPYWYLTQADAIEHGTKMVSKAIVALRKKLNKLEGAFWTKTSEIKIALKKKE